MSDKMQIECRRCGKDGYYELRPYGGLTKYRFHCTDCDQKTDHWPKRPRHDERAGAGYRSSPSNRSSLLRTRGKGRDARIREPRAPHFVDLKSFLALVDVVDEIKERLVDLELMEFDPPAPPMFLPSPDLGAMPASREAQAPVEIYDKKILDLVYIPTSPMELADTAQFLSTCGLDGLTLCSSLPQSQLKDLVRILSQGSAGDCCSAECARDELGEREKEKEAV